MGQVNVTISGKAYRMACDDGQEEHLAGLADNLNASIERLREQFGEIGELRLTVMAAIMLADQHADALRRLAIAEDRLAGERQVAEQVAALAERVEALVAGLAAEPPREVGGS